MGSTVTTPKPTNNYYSDILGMSSQQKRQRDFFKLGAARLSSEQSALFNSNYTAGMNLEDYTASINGAAGGVDQAQFDTLVGNREMSKLSDGISNKTLMSGINAGLGLWGAYNGHRQVGVMEDQLKQNNFFQTENLNMQKKAFNANTEQNNYMKGYANSFHQYS